MPSPSFLEYRMRMLFMVLEVRRPSHSPLFDQPRLKRPSPIANLRSPGYRNLIGSTRSSLSLLLLVSILCKPIHARGYNAAIETRSADVNIELHPAKYITAVGAFIRRLLIRCCRDGEGGCFPDVSRGGIGPTPPPFLLQTGQFLLFGLIIPRRLRQPDGVI